jgi:hypothetical protein
MANKDTKKIYKYALIAYEWTTDLWPPKKFRNFKKKERQDGKKEIRKELKHG